MKANVPPRPALLGAPCCIGNEILRSRAGALASQLHVLSLGIGFGNVVSLVNYLRTRGEGEASLGAVPKWSTKGRGSSQKATRNGDQGDSVSNVMCLQEENGSSGGDSITGSEASLPLISRGLP